MDSLPQQTWRGADAGSAPARRAMVLSGGVALGAFEAGAYAALEEAGAPLPDWFVGASIGAVNAAIVAGNPPGRRVERLRRFWDSVARDPTPATSFLLGPHRTGAHGGGPTTRPPPSRLCFSAGPGCSGRGWPWASGWAPYPPSTTSNRCASGCRNCSTSTC